MEYRRLGSEQFEAFDPARVAVLDRAFRRAWNFLKENGDTDYLNDEAAREAVAMHVIAAAENGENNVLRVTDLAIEQFRFERDQIRNAQQPSLRFIDQISLTPVKTD